MKDRRSLSANAAEKCGKPLNNLRQRPQDLELLR